MLEYGNEKSLPKMSRDFVKTISSGLCTGADSADLQNAHDKLLTEPNIT